MPKHGRGSSTVTVHYACLVFTEAVVVDTSCYRTTALIVFSLWRYQRKWVITVAADKTITTDDDDDDVRGPPPTISTTVFVYYYDLLLQFSAIRVES